MSKKVNKSNIFITTAILVILLGIAGVVAQSAQNAVRGWIWSPNIGWISMSSQDTGAGGGVPYGVYIDQSGFFNGYAWSPNIGWVSFNQSDLQSAPVCFDTTRAQVSTSTGRIIGGARALSGVGRNDGWDGCMRLSEGTAGNIFPTGHPDGSRGLTYNPSAKSIIGYAWGGSAIGWMQFNAGVNMPGVTCPDCGSSGGNLAGICTFSPSSHTLPDGQSAIIVTPNLSASGGTSPYTYTPLSFTLPAGYYSGLLVRVLDASGASGQITCSPVTVNGNDPVTDGVRLAIDSSVSLAEASVSTQSPKTYLRRTVGQPFALAWRSTLPETYSCLGGVTPSPSTQPWVSSLTSALTEDYTSNSQALSTSGESIGTYTFTISCFDSAETPGPNASASVQLRISSSDIIEI